MSENAGIGPIDRMSMWVSAVAETRVERIEERLQGAGLSLGAQPPSVMRGSLAEWLEGPYAGRRVEGGRLASAVAGIELRLPSGKTFWGRPVPRSAAGPALAQLFLGSGGALATLRSATLRAEPLAEKVETLGFQGDASTVARWLLAATRGIAPPLWVELEVGERVVCALGSRAGSAWERLQIGEAAAAARALGLEPAPVLSPWDGESLAERELAAEDWDAALRGLGAGSRARLVRVARESAVWLVPERTVDSLPPPPRAASGLDALQAALQEAIATG